MHVTSQGWHIEHGKLSGFIQTAAIAKHGGKTCAAGAPGQISCTSSSYSPGNVMHIFPKNEKVRAQWVKFVRTHRPDFQPTDYSYLCSLHFNESCFTRVRLSALMPTTTSEESKTFVSDWQAVGNLLTYMQSTVTVFAGISLWTSADWLSYVRTQ